MRILWLNAGPLLPLDKGGKLRTYHLLRHLARRHTIGWLSYVDPDRPPPDPAGMAEVAQTVHAIPRRTPAKHSLWFAAAAARHLLNRLPYAVGAYSSQAYRQRVSDLLVSGRYDLVVSDFLPPAANLPRRPRCPAVLFTHNVEAEIWRRHLETAAAWWKRPFLRQQWQRMLRFEGEAVRRFDLVLAVSDTDRDTLHRLYGPLRPPVRVVPTGVDTAYFAPAWSEERTHHLVFTGSMDWLPNEDGVLHFVRDVLPRIRERLPDVTLAVVGRDPSPPVRRLADRGGIEVTGRVDDVRPYVAAGALSIVPLRIGGGTRLKIFEAMAMGKAVVSTSVGAEGLPVTDGEHVRIADAPDDFADAVVSLLADASARRSLGERARALVTTRFDWAAAAEHLESALLEAARLPPVHRPALEPEPDRSPQPVESATGGFRA